MATYELVLARTETVTVKMYVEAASKAKARDLGHELMDEDTFDWDSGEVVWAEEEVNEINLLPSA